MTVPRLPYPAYLLKQLKVIGPAHEVEDRLARIVGDRYKSPQAGFQDEARTHRAHNINTNFDTIEVSGSYDQTMRTAIHVIAGELLEEGLISPIEARQFAALVRVEDPADPLVTMVRKPTHIDWVADNRSLDEFAQFADWDSLISRIRAPAHPWITLFEETEHRISDGMGGPKSARVSKSTMSLFVLPETAGQQTQEELEGLRTEWLNRYRYELPVMRAGPDAADLLAKGHSMAQLSIRHLRGSRPNIIAAVPPGLAKILGRKRDAADYFGLWRRCRCSIDGVARIFRSGAEAASACVKGVLARDRASLLEEMG